jgi:ApaG protein
VETLFIDDQSDPDEGYYVWAYRITIVNLGEETVQLLARHWKITDALGRLQEVKGDGVVGEQPTLLPGADYTYSSGTPLTTSSGFMCGHYLMRTASGRDFDAEIPAFSLVSPFAKTALH